MASMGFSWFIAIVIAVDGNLVFLIPSILLALLLTWAQVEYIKFISEADNSN